MKMKSILILILFANQIVIGQSFEQIALDFYASEILDNQKNKKVFFDGIINPIDSQYQELSEFVIERFYYCKADPRGVNNDKIKVKTEEWTSICKQVKIDIFEPLIQNSEKLIIKNPIRKRKKLKYKKLRGGIHFIAERFWHSIFPVKYNLTVEPVISYKEYYYVWLRESKRDFEYGNWFFIKISKDKIVEDWCEVSWIQ